MPSWLNGRDSSSYKQLNKDDMNWRETALQEMACRPITSGIGSRNHGWSPMNTRGATMTVAPANSPHFLLTCSISPAPRRRARTRDNATWQLSRVTWFGVLPPRSARGRAPGPAFRTGLRFSDRLHRRQRKFPAGSDARDLKRLAGMGRDSEQPPRRFNRVQLPGRCSASGPATAIGAFRLFGLQSRRSPGRVNEWTAHFGSDSIA